MDELFEALPYILVFLIAVSLCLIIGCAAGRGEIVTEAISLGHAQYNPTNANFEWKVCK